MTARPQRKNSVDTMAEAFGWLKRNPELILLFLIVGLVDGLGEVSFLFGLLGFLLLIVADAVAHRYAYAEVREVTTSIGDEVGHVLGRLLSLVGATLIYFVAVTIGLLLLILPGIYLAIRLSLAFPAIVIDDENALGGLETSWNVAKGNLLKLFGISVLAFLALFSTGIVAGVVGVAFESVVAVATISAVVTAIVSPIVQLSYARVYLENRPDSESGSTDRDDDPWGSTGDETRTNAADAHW
ncbi:glycerophosphoryl diester phosphodiesterase membrane domain-containing protein [Natronococcus sp. A-GB1]|uniref:glycerophosphoryl diester phosphodiesterase membrane domain-containing protein n=1 Tax=Natronococcus sp. A-GB1 TaxID=3037648 RepID=UPI00241C51BE|nr:glycerophosphoryl diester phosphodiesterase membrane domain-containing protein [Natronococcus sp. A-GB1]MDG5761398.1 glycerophosphoryl diester phosphodiesterase membrane domain-containing protein [Natronococcus sp. A-GB1]